MKKLLIVESPAKIKTIGKFLGKQFRIMSTLGHIKDLPKKKLGVTINGSIVIDYVPLEKKDKVIADICKAASQANEIYLAPDPDREGEIIAWHVAQEIEKVVENPDIIHRITFNEITQSAIEEALRHPTVIDEQKVAAQQARRILDRWVGYEVSPVLWRKIAKGLSAGRVQSVALKLICMREEEIRSFKPEEYWSIEGVFDAAGKPFNAELVQFKGKKISIPDSKTATKFVDDIKPQQFTVTGIKDSKRQKKAPAPFMTSTLQQAAYNRLGFSVQKTMTVAQKLYEGVELGNANPTALITYMRTDSLRIAESAIKQLRQHIDKHFGKEYLPPKSLVYSTAKGQDAHEAIRPVDVTITPTQIKPYVPAELFKLYELIWRRFVACQMKAAQYAQRQVNIEGGPYLFKVTGSTLLFDGFLKVYAADEDEDKKGTPTLPSTITEKMVLGLEKIEPKQHFTQPPPRFTEASLVKEMEKDGIGRPSTYATILKTIQLREYTTLDNKKRFVPTELGMAVTRLLDENLPTIMNISFTANMEEDLDKVAQGKMERDKVLREFYKDFSKALKAFAGITREKQAEETNITCPACGKHKLVIRFGKTGSFLGCKGYPECTFSANFERTEDGSIKILEKKEPELLKEKCPQCGKPLQKRVGRYGPFISCSGYPECKYIHQEKTTFLCPACGKGPLVKRNWKGRVFWCCSTYPKCKFSIPGDIVETTCPKCKAPYLLKKTDRSGTTEFICASKECGYRQKDSE